jgi:NadR type nicotinamide-nucleotide adenylyltransferase
VSDLEIKRIALIGPESSGKTTLCRQLANYFNTHWVPEYARSYIENLNRAYTSDDILLIAKEQFKTEESLMQTANNLLFTDTEFINAKVWCEDVFGFCPDWILRKVTEKKYDLFLLTKPDLPWEKDAVRENPNRRDYFYELYLKEIETRNFNYKIISGSGEERFQNAVMAVKSFL